MYRWNVKSNNWLPFAAYEKIYEQRSELEGTTCLDYKSTLEEIQFPGLIGP